MFSISICRWTIIHLYVALFKFEALYKQRGDEVVFSTSETKIDFYLTKDRLLF